MSWYIVPVFADVRPTGTFYLPGIGVPGSVVAYCTGRCIMHAHQPKNKPETVLMGITSPMNEVPDGWEALTLTEARSHFESVTGRTPTVAEVF